MRFRMLAAVLMVCGTALVTGCPDGSDFGQGFGSADDVIEDGTYVGNASDTYELWYAGQLYAQDVGGGPSDVTFLNGEALKDSGGVLQIGDVEQVDYGIFRASRQVYDIWIGDWAYEAYYDVTAQMDTIPMTGTAYITFYENSDGSITMFETLELISLDAFDGGTWAIHASSSGTLAPFSGYEDPPHDILDDKSGKIIVDDSITR